MHNRCVPVADLLYQRTVLNSRLGNLLSKCHTHPHQHSYAHNRGGPHPAAPGLDSGCAHRGGVSSAGSIGMSSVAALHYVFGEQEQVRRQDQFLLQYEYRTSEGGRGVVSNVESGEESGEMMCRNGEGRAGRERARGRESGGEREGVEG